LTTDDENTSNGKRKMTNEGFNFCLSQISSINFLKKNGKDPCCGCVNIEKEKENS